MDTPPPQKRAALHFSKAGAFMNNRWRRREEIKGIYTHNE